jgi:hypothetical protein
MKDMRFAESYTTIDEERRIECARGFCDSFGCIDGKFIM